MVRLLLFIFILCAANFSGIAKDRLDSSSERLSCSQSGSSSEYVVNDDLVFFTGILEKSFSESELFSDLRKDLLSTHQIYVSQSRNVFHFSDLNLLFYIRKDNIFLSVLRL